MLSRSSCYLKWLTGCQITKRGSLQCPSSADSLDLLTRSWQSSSWDTLRQDLLYLTIPVKVFIAIRFQVYIYNLVIAKTRASWFLKPGVVHPPNITEQMFALSSSDTFQFLSWFLWQQLYLWQPGIFSHHCSHQNIRNLVNYFCVQSRIISDDKLNLDLAIKTWESLLFSHMV